MSALLIAAEAAAEHHNDIGIHPYAVGAIALVIMMALLMGLLVFGKGREHS